MLAAVKRYGSPKFTYELDVEAPAEFDTPGPGMVRAVDSTGSKLVWIPMPVPDLRTRLLAVTAEARAAGWAIAWWNPDELEGVNVKDLLDGDPVRRGLYCEQQPEDEGHNAMPREHQNHHRLHRRAEHEAKEKAGTATARQSDYAWWEGVYSDAVEMAALMGIEIGTRRGSKDTAISFSGFCSQGDGASFEGTYHYRKGGLKALQSAAPAGYKDADTGQWVEQKANIELHEIARTLQQIQRPFLYKLEAVVKQRGHYLHSGCTHIEVTHADSMYRDIGDAEDGIAQALREFMDWIYARLEAEYDWLNSDKNIEDSIEANECEFREDGTRY